MVKKRKQETIADIVARYRENEPQPVVDQDVLPLNEVILKAELEQTRNDLAERKKEASYNKKHYTACTLSEEVIRMETGLPTKEVFQIFVRHATRFKEAMVCYAGWKVVGISFEDQIFITLMKLRQNYTNLH